MPDAKLTMPADGPGQGPRDRQTPAGGGRPIPLRLAPGRFWLWCVGLVLFAVITLAAAAIWITGWQRQEAVKAPSLPSPLAAGLP